MLLSAYLSLSRHGVFYFRWPLPRTDRDCRPYIRVSLRTRCAVRAGTLARYFASCGEITRDNKELARLRQDKLRELVRDFFHAQLAQYIEWIGKRGLASAALEDARAEMHDHEDHLDSQRLTSMYLPVEHFRRKMGVTDENWIDSLPHAITEMRKGRRDMLRAVIEAAESPEQYSYSDAPPQPSPAPVAAPDASARLGDAVEDFMVEHARQWPAKTVRQMRSYFNILLEYLGPDRRLSQITKQDAIAVKKVLQALPSSRNTKPALRQVFKHAMRYDLPDRNPADGIEMLKSGSDGYHSWTLAEIQTFKEKHPIGTTARLAMALALYTGQRRGDLVQFGKQHVREGSLIFTQNKGRNRNPIILELPIIPALQNVLDASPTGDLTFLVTAHGRPFTNNGFGNRFRDWCDAAGLPNCSVHGLRKAAAARLAELGCTEFEIMAITGHQTSKEVTRYTKAASQKVRAANVLVKLTAERN